MTLLMLVEGGRLWLLERLITPWWLKKHSDNYPLNKNRKAIDEREINLTFIKIDFFCAI